MCTLVLRTDFAGAPRIALGVNRDEALARPSAAPALLAGSPRVLGGRDRLAGGTWLAVRLDPPRRVVAVLNRQETSPPRAPAAPGGAAAPGHSGAVTGRRSRGLLCLDAALAPDAGAAERAALAHVQRFASGPFNLLVAGPDALVLVCFDGEHLWREALAPGLHALTHGRPDDPGDARVASILERSAAAPAGVPEFLGAAQAALGGHDGAGAPCRHADGYGTVSSSLLALDFETGAGLWRYAAGPPCRTPYFEVGGFAARLRA